MHYYAGLDVSNQTTNICVIDSNQKVLFETVCSTEPAPIAEALEPYRTKLKHVGLEAGSLTFWLVDELRQSHLPAVCLDSRHVAQVLSTVINKTDKNDARGIARILASGFFTIVHQKSPKAIKIGLLMRARSGLIADRTAKKNRIRGLLKAYGIRVHTCGHQSFVDQVKESIDFQEDDIVQIITTLLKDYERCEKAVIELDAQVQSLARKTPEAKLLQTAAGVGPITALSFIAEIDDPKRFLNNPRDVGAYLGLTPRQYSSGESTRLGGISRSGSPHMRALLYEAAVVLLRHSKKWSKLKAWGLKLLKRMSFKKAATAVARRLAIILVRMWQTGKSFQFGSESEAKAHKKNSSSSSPQVGSIIASPQSGIKAKPSGLATRGLDPHSACLA